MTKVDPFAARHGLQAADGPRLRSRRRAVRDRVGLGLRRRQRRLRRLPDRLRRGRQGPDRRRHRHRRPAASRRWRSASPAPAPATPRAARSPTPGTSTATATSTRPTANPSYTYTTNGAYTAKLTVKDQTGLTGVENILITVGNRAPDGHDRDAAQRQARVLHGQDPVQGLRHRPRGRHDRRGHRLRQRHGHDLARP